MTTIADKIWDAHLVVQGSAEEGDLLYVDLHLLQEVSSPQAFSGLEAKKRRVRRPDLTLAMEDHNIPTNLLSIDNFSPDSRKQVLRLRENCLQHGIELFSTGDIEQGIVHVVAPQLGLSQPGMTIVCGDSHTSTHGAFGALAFGIGTSQVEHVLATQTLRIPRFKTLGIEVTGQLASGVTSKDLIMAVINTIGVSGGQGYVIEYFGEAIRSLSMESRMTLCNMSIEAGARAGLICPDTTTFDYLQEKLDLSPHELEEKKHYWSQWKTDSPEDYDAIRTIDGSSIEPMISWGTNPGQTVNIRGSIPSPAVFNDPSERQAAEDALAYMGLHPGTPIKNISINTVFIGSCTNGRIEDLREAAGVLKGRKVAEHVRALIVPGSERIRHQAEKEGLADIFINSGALWRHAGCSMCLGMNDDRMTHGDRSVSTSNRNFVGRQGPGSHTHLASPIIAAASAVAGHIAEPEDLRDGLYE